MTADAPSDSSAGAPDRPAAVATSELILGLLRRTHLSTARDLPRVVVEQAALIGAQDVELYLVDAQQGALMALPTGRAPAGEPLSVTGTVAGRAFSTTTILRAPGATPQHQRLWLPLLDGTERVGVLGMSFAVEAIDEQTVELCERYAHLVAMLIASKSAYSDEFEIVRRRKQMTIASELAHAVAPPMVFATDGVTIAGMLEPAYDNGGDALDYALNERLLHLAVFDAMGHGLAAAGVAAFAISAYRHSRRAGKDLLDTYAAMDEAVGERFPGNRFVTALIAQIDLAAGRLRWISAGHPPPLLLPGGRRARALETAPAPPLGIKIPAPPPVVSEMSLQPGDQLLLYTDGLTDAHGPDGERLEIEGLSAFIEHEAAAGHPAPETLRRLRQAILTSDRTRLRDDATALLLEWRRGTEAALVPETVL